MLTSSPATPAREVLVHRCRRFTVRAGPGGDGDRGPWLACEPPLDAASPEPGGITVVLAGQLYAGDPAALAGTCRDPRAPLAVEGSFAAVVLARGDAWVITDHVGSWQLYVQSSPQETTVSTDPPAAAAVDPLGLAAYLAGGHVIGRRTPFAGVEVAPPASIAAVRPGMLAWSPYWSFEPQARGSLATGEFARELEPLLLSAVERRLAAGAPVAVSLSGGSDVRTILAALVEVVECSRVRSFSYALPGTHGRTDAAVAARLARLAGIRHRIVSSRPPSLLALTELNARRGAAVANLCDEAHAWQRAGLGEDDVVVVGDEALGWVDEPLASVDDVLRVLEVPSRLHLEELLPPRELAALTEEYRETLLELVSGSGVVGDLHELKDALYVRHRLARVLAPWRRRYAGERAMVAAPLLDRRILDLVARLGTEDRLDKRAFREFARSRFARFFEIPLARRTGYFLDWSALVAAERDAVVAALEQPGATDRLIHPAAARRLVDAVATRSHRARRRARRLAHAAGRRLPVLGVPGGAWLDERRLTAPEVQLVRLLVVRERLAAARRADEGSDGCG